MVFACVRGVANVGVDPFNRHGLYFVFMFFALMENKDIKEPFCHVAVYPFLDGGVCGYVQCLFQASERVEQPSAVQIEALPGTDKHIERRQFIVLNEHLFKRGVIFRAVCLNRMGEGS